MARKLIALAIVAGLVLAGCGGPASTPTALPEAGVYPGADWAWADSPESMGWSSDKLALAQAYAERIGSAAVMIVDNGVVIDAWGDLAHKYQCHSMRKSLISALYGIYVAEGKIDLTATLKELGIDDRTALTEVEKTATIAHLLSARSGVYIEAAGEAPSMKAMRPPRGSHEPGTFWYYNNWDFNALGTIFDQLSGEENIYTAFDRRIAGPIGMQDYDPEELHYFYETYSRHPYYGFRMSTRDLARFGLLFLRDGRWGEQQVVPADWVRESTASHSVIGPGSGYGYMWWTGEGAGGFPNVGEGPGSYYASGYGGHNVIVMPARKLVVVHRADTDAGQMVDESSIGTLLWMILEAAGEAGIGDPPLLERAAGTHLTGDTLAQALEGSTLRVVQVGAEIIATYGPEQTVSVSLNGEPLVEGRWWIEGDHYCHDLGPEYGGPECGQLVLNDNQLEWFDLDGYLAMTFEYGQPATSAPAPPTPTVDSAKAAEYLDVFEMAWQAVNDTYFDPDFGGVDWRAEHDRYEPLIAKANDDQAFYHLLNEMLWKLNVSHTGAMPADRWQSVEPVVAAEGTTGLELRLLGSEAVITRVEPGSSAEEAGLRPGFVLESIDGVAIEQILAEAEAELSPPYNERGRIDGLTRSILSRVYGPPDTCVTLAYLDGQGAQYQECVMRIRREREATLPGVALPPSFLEFEAKRLAWDIGYIRFNTFNPDLIPDMESAVEAMRDAPGIIIDLRGNPGGYLPAAQALAAQFLKEQANLGTFKTRDGAGDLIVEPAEKTYGGPVIILIDRLSYSGSEWFAAGMQAIGRAVIIGEQSPGGVTGADVKALPNGAILIYPVLQLTARDGTPLEGRGVIPDIQVELDRELLLQGIDSQLEAAIETIEGVANGD